jgi:hypothetical protein
MVEDTFSGKIVKNVLLPLTLTVLTPKVISPYHQYRTTGWSLHIQQQTDQALNC